MQSHGESIHNIGASTEVSRLVSRLGASALSLQADKASRAPVSKTCAIDSHVQSCLQIRFGLYKYHEQVLGSSLGALIDITNRISCGLIL